MGTFENGERTLNLPPHVSDAMERFGEAGFAYARHKQQVDAMPVGAERDVMIERAFDLLTRFEGACADAMTNLRRAIESLHDPALVNVLANILKQQDVARSGLTGERTKLEALRQARPS